MAMLHSELTRKILGLKNDAFQIMNRLDALLKDTTLGVVAEGVELVSSGAPVLAQEQTKSEIDRINNEIDKALNETPRIVDSIQDKPLPFGAILPRDFLDGVVWIEESIGLSAYNLMVCMGFETMGTFDPKIRPRRKDGSLISSAVGLIQFMDATAKRLGTTVEALLEMSRVEQLNYVFKYFNDYRKRGHDLSKWNLGDTYMAILWPTGIGKADDFPCFVEGKGAAYAANHGLDVNKDGIVTRGECLVQVRKYEKIGLSKLG